MSNIQLVDVAKHWGDTTALEGITLDIAAGSSYVLLAGLEHLDDRYLRAVGYATKSKRGGLPKMVLLDGSMTFKSCGSTR